MFSISWLLLSALSCPLCSLQMRPPDWFRALFATNYSSFYTNRTNVTTWNWTEYTPYPTMYPTPVGYSFFVDIYLTSCRQKNCCSRDIHAGCRRCRLFPGTAASRRRASTRRTTPAPFRGSDCSTSGYRSSLERKNRGETLTGFRPRTPAGSHATLGPTRRRRPRP